jgi:hypothetical protein
MREWERQMWVIVLALSAAVASVVVVVTLLMTHVVAPLVLRHTEHFPALARVPKLTKNAKGIDGDPVNIALIGSDSDIVHAFRAAHWVQAAPVTRASSIGIATSVLFNRPDSAAPVSPLYLFGRQQDMAWEREINLSARQRHHVRLWRVANIAYAGRPVWIGDASYDLRAGISHRGFHPTHHIAPDIDEERDTLTGNLIDAGRVLSRFHVTGIGIRVDARNAEGDRYDTDGEIQALVLSQDDARHAAPPPQNDPPLVALKDKLWSWAHRRYH